MQNPLSFLLESDGALSRAVRTEGFFSFDKLAEYIRSLPYGRITPSASGVGVLRERRGTCSSKHQFLAFVARECRHPEVALTIGIYEMCEQNTPGVGAVLNAASVTNIPEAHCYLTVYGARFDFTGLLAGEFSPFESLLSEHTVLPEEITEVKAKLHMLAISTWAAKIGISNERAWSIREACIAALAADKNK